MNTQKTLITSAILTSLSLTAQANTANTANNTTDNKAVSVTEVIEVKGEFTPRPLKTTPISIGVINDAAIERRAATHLEEVLSNAANINFAAGSSRARFFQIRGLGAQGEFGSPVNYPVGLYIDDIDMSNMATGATLFDVEQVEVFRGPQGTRFGTNALAGLIYLQSAAPTDTPSGKFKFGLGNYNAQELGAAFSNGITDSLSYRVSAHQYKNDGFIDNTHLDLEDTNKRDELTLKGKLRFSPNKDFIWDLNAFHVNVNNGYDAFSLDNTRETLSDNPGHDKQKTTAFSSNLKVKLNNEASFHSILTYADSDIAYTYDEDWAFEGIHPDGYSAVDSYLHDKRNYSAEFRFLSEPEGQLFGNTDWVAGLFIQKTTNDLSRIYTYDSQFNSTLDNEKRALFIQTDTALTDKITLTAGLRYEQNELTYTNNREITVAPDFSMLGGKLGLGYTFNDTLFGYVSINRGYQAGNVNINTNLTEAPRVFDPEFLWNYETGLKYQNNDVFVRIAAFYMDRQDAQVSRNETYFSDGKTKFAPFTSNAETGFTKGIELESSWAVNSDTSLYVNIGILEAEYQNLPEVGEIQAIAGRKFSQAPDYTFNLGLNHYFSDSTWFNVEVDKKDAFYFSDDHDTQSLSHALINASISTEYENIIFKLWGRNLTDEDTYIQGFRFGNDPRDGYTEKSYYQYGEPRVFGVSAEFSF